MVSLAFTIARTTFIESVRQPIYFILIALSGAFHFFNTASVGYALEYSSSGELSNDNKLLLDIGLANVLFCGTLLAGFIATAAISREIENRTLLTIVSKPVPRVSVVLGKYLGTCAAVMIATVIMLVFLQMSIRHGALSTAADDPDQPVILLSLAAIGIACAVAVWGNYFYGWHFVQVSTLLVCPLILVAWVLVLVLSKKWDWQPIGRDFKPQVITASACLLLALAVLTAAAVAASTRLGQVMTIMVCFGVFVAGLLSNHLIGRHAFANTLVGQVQSAEPERESARGLDKSGDIVFVRLRTAPAAAIAVGDTFHYGPLPNGLTLAAGPYPKWNGNPADDRTFFARATSAALVVLGVEGTKITVRNLGFEPAPLNRAPRAEDFVFVSPTRTNWTAVAAWGVVPNMQFFWLSDAVTQNRPVPAGHLALVAGYAGTQVVFLLSLAVLLFQKRDVG